MRPVAVIGAGPYGLATAAHLKGKNVPVRIFGDPLGRWRHNMPTGMVLKSTPVATSISSPAPGHTLQDFCDVTGVPRLEHDHQVVPLETFVRYGLWFQQQLVPEVENVEVSSVVQSGAGWELKLDTGEQFDAHAVVVATGLTGLAHLPAVLSSIAPDGPSPDGPLSHSSQHDDLTRYAGSEVLVVGAGSSALESAALLHEAGAQVKVLVRGRSFGFGGPPTAGPHWQPNAPVGRGWAPWALCHGASAFRYLPDRTRLHLVRTILGPLGGWWLEERVTGKFPVEVGQQIVAAKGDASGAVLTTESADRRRTEHRADHVLAATGYRVDIQSMGWLAPALRARLATLQGAPRLDARSQSTVPGLYFTGLPSAATFGPVVRFVCGTEFAAPRIARAIDLARD